MLGPLPKLYRVVVSVAALLVFVVGGAIGMALGISVKTVEKHRQSLMDKLNIHQIAGLTRYAVESCLVSKEDAVPAVPA